MDAGKAGKTLVMAGMAMVGATAQVGLSLVLVGKLLAVPWALEAALRDAEVPAPAAVDAADVADAGAPEADGEGRKPPTRVVAS